MTEHERTVVLQQSFNLISWYSNPSRWSSIVIVVARQVFRPRVFNALPHRLGCYIIVTQACLTYILVFALQEQLFCAYDMRLYKHQH